MRKIFLSIVAGALLLAVGVLAPSRAMAGTTTYIYNFFATGSGVVSPLAANPSSQFGVVEFYAELGKDVAKGTKTCPDLSSTGTTTFTSAVSGLLKKIGTVAGDTTYSNGTITTPGPGAKGPLTGVAYFGGWSAASGLANGDILNSTNSASSALLCGGNAGSSGPPGSCGNGTNCVSGSLATVADPNNLTNCADAGQGLNTAGTLQVETITAFVYPYAGDLCNTPGETLADCCHDKNLVIISNTENASSNFAAGPSTIGIVTSQGDAGFTNAWAQ